MFKAIPFATILKTETYEEQFVAFGKHYKLTTTESDICGSLEWRATVNDVEGIEVMTMDYCKQGSEWVVTDWYHQTHVSKLANPINVAKRIISSHYQLIGA